MRRYEIVRILAQAKTSETVRFLAFSGEEEGYWGSDAYAQLVQADGVKLKLLINLDEIGYPPASRAIKVERDQGNAASANDGPSQEYAAIMAQMAADYANLPVLDAPIYWERLHAI